MGDISYIFVPGPKGGGHNQCIVVRGTALSVATASELEHAPHVREYLHALGPDEPITLEIGELDENDVDLIRRFGDAHGRAVVARRTNG